MAPHLRGVQRLPYSGRALFLHKSSFSGIRYYPASESLNGCSLSSSHMCPGNTCSSSPDRGRSHWTGLDVEMTTPTRPLQSTLGTPWLGANGRFAGATSVGGMGSVALRIARLAHWRLGWWCGEAWLGHSSRTAARRGRHWPWRPGCYLSFVLPDK